MSVIAIAPGYHGEMKDSVDRFHGQQLLNVLWEDHLLFAWPMCVPLPPQMPFAALVSQVLPGIFGSHPDFARIDWATVEWRIGLRPFTPDPERGLADNGLVHKALLRFRTPGLRGIGGTCN